MIPREGWLGDLVRESKRIANIPVYPGIGVIATHSHLAPAMVFLRSLKKHHPSCKVYLLLADADESAIESTTIATAVRTMVGDVQVVSPYRVTTADLIEDGRSRYGATEWCCALKPALLRYVLAQGHRNACYFDTDMRVYAPMSAAFRQLWTASILLSPHLHEPLPEDGFVPRDSTILRAGTFNGGFVGVRNCAEAHRFLNWWQARVMQYGAIDGLLNHGDQNWLNLVPALFPGCEVNRDPGFNAAYWNIVGKQLTISAGVLHADGAPISLFHYSGAIKNLDNRLSRHETRLSPQYQHIRSVVDVYQEEIAEVAARLPSASRSNSEVHCTPPRTAAHVIDSLQHFRARVAQPELSAEPGSAKWVDVVCESTNQSGQEQSHQEVSFDLVCIASMSQPACSIWMECGRLTVTTLSTGWAQVTRIPIRTPTILGTVDLSVSIVERGAPVPRTAPHAVTTKMRVGF